jgi:hypothetical protein
MQPSLGQLLRADSPAPVRIFPRLQVGELRDSTMALSRWADLFAAMKVAFDVTASLRSLLARCSKARQRPDLEVVPLIGELDAETSAGLVAALGAAEPCYFVMTRQGPIRVYAGSVSGLLALHRRPLFEPPDAVVAVSGSWVLVQPTDCTSAYFAGDGPAAAAVLAAPAVEAVAIAKDTAIDDWTARG